MKSGRIWALGAAIILAGFLLTFSGCYVTKTPLGDAANASVNSGYVGDFSITSDNGKTGELVIRNLDDKQYAVNWKPADGKASLFVGYTADVNSVTFVNLRELPDDGTISSDYFILRVSINQDHSELRLRNLKDDFFKDKQIDSAKALRQVLSQNLDNDAMYDGPEMVATRQAEAKK